MTAKVADCLALGGVEGVTPGDLSWDTGASLLSTRLGGRAS
jgi:hypothetical protein